MSRTRPDTGDTIMLAYRCGRPECLAFPEQWCRTPRGGYAPMLHASRFYAATADGKFPLTGNGKGD